MLLGHCRRGWSLVEDGEEKEEDDDRSQHYRHQCPRVKKRMMKSSEEAVFG